jgi:hypothetical protein
MTVPRTCPKFRMNMVLKGSFLQLFAARTQEKYLLAERTHPFRRDELVTGKRIGLFFFFAVQTS